MFLPPPPGSMQHGKVEGWEGGWGTQLETGILIERPHYPHSKKNNRIFSFFILTNLISRSRRGKEGGRESGARRERGVSILYFQRCIKHIATVTGQQQVPAQQVPREHRASFPPLSPSPSSAQKSLAHLPLYWVPRVDAWQRITPGSEGRGQASKAGSRLV